jgi:hypothetical protein
MSESVEPSSRTINVDEDIPSVWVIPEDIEITIAEDVTVTVVLVGPVAAQNEVRLYL